jgi:hypothetical protein
MMYPGLVSWAKFSRPYGTKILVLPHRLIQGTWSAVKKPLSPRIHCNEAYSTSSPAPQQQTDCREGNGPVGSEFSVTAIVQQDVAAPAPLLIVQKTASYPLRQILGVSGFPIVRSHIPHHRRQPKFASSAQHIRPARAEGRPNISHYFSGCILDDGSTRNKLLPDLSGACPHQGRMAHGMVSQEVPSTMDRPGNFWTLAYIATHQEKCSPHLPAVQQFKQLHGVRIIGTVIEGQCNFIYV